MTPSSKVMPPRSKKKASMVDKDAFTQTDKFPKIRMKGRKYRCTFINLFINYFVQPLPLRSGSIRDRP